MINNRQTNKLTDVIQSANVKYIDNAEQCIVYIVKYNVSLG